MTLEQIVAMRQAGQGEIAKSLGYRNLGQAKRDVQGTDRAVGEATIALALSQEIARRETGVTQEQALAMVLARREAGQGWG